MQIAKRNEGSIVILAPVGDMGLYNLGQLRQMLHDLRANGSLRVVIDMANVPGIDSISIGFLLQETSLFLEHNGELKIAQISASVHKSLRMTETLSQMDVHADIASAIASFSKFKPENQ